MLYLVRHGIAKAGCVDPDPPLSDMGKGGLEKVAKFLGDAGVQVARVAHSGKRRARETAEILSTAVLAGGELAQIPGIRPNDEVDDFAREVADWTADTLVVGHLPFMALAVGRLTCGTPLPVADFAPGTVVALQPAGGGRWEMVWMVRPDLLEKR